MEQYELTKILEAHKKWLEGDGGERADLREANLQGANLLWADLRGANLQGADLQGANLRWADLQEANLRGANLQGADLRWANLRGANLQGADLQGANLRWADLQEANLRWANNIILLPVQDPRGHSFPHAVWHGDQWMVRSGCKCLSISDAAAYVSSKSFSGEPWLRDCYLHAFGWLTAWAAVRCELGVQK